MTIQHPDPSDRALAATAIASLAELPTDLIVAVLVAAAAVIRSRGIGPLPIVMALAEAVGPFESVQKRRPVGAATEAAVAGTEGAREEVAVPVPFRR